VFEETERIFNFNKLWLACALEIDESNNEVYKSLCIFTSV